MLRKIRIILAAVMLVGITWLFVYFTGLAHLWLGWMADIQFLPSVLALNVVVIVGLVLLTLLFGRAYCSIICPLGVMQDVFGWMGRKVKKNRYTYSAAKTWLRLSVLVVFVALMVLGMSGIASIIAPYSAYGRISQALLQPLWELGNNVLAGMAERMDSYAFYSVDVWVRSLPVLIVAVVTLVVLAVLAWRGGRTYCNTICPVGTVLGYVARFSLLKVRIDESKCNKCGLCGRNCKAACIDSKGGRIDYTRCVDCMDCLGKCRKGALSYGVALAAKSENGGEKGGGPDNSGRREFLATTAVLGTIALQSQAKKVDGGLAVIKDKRPYERGTKVVPPGSLSISNLQSKCTGCQLCISKCPNEVLRPSTDLLHLMQPESSFERGYCRPECVTCADVCPAGAITPISQEQKASTQVGHAVWMKDNCVAVKTDDGCGLCARKCPVGAIEMVFTQIDGRDVIAPAVNEEMCIGCGACEYYCPSRPYPAIHVEGHEVHKEV